ncbi:MAG: hypothetical protein WBB85_02430 [Albidovulum sp.]|uniref:hypothetical protein n=1 Tax=Albidovulum sp. TaxID=1872424 RepID=UPI003C927BE1
MSDLALEWARIRAGTWEAEIASSGDAAPRIEIWHLDQKLETLKAGARTGNGRWPVSFAIPSGVLADGVQTFLVRDEGSGDKIGQFSIVTGEPLEDDLRAEIDLLRAELDMLKKAFRRHCLETAGR